MTLRRDMIDVVGTGFTVLDRLYADGDFTAEALGGSCGNVLVSLAMLHRQVAPVLALGLDEIGEQLLAEFETAGADTRYIHRHAGRRSPVLRQELDTRSGQHSFSFTCRDTFEEYPRYQPIGHEELQSATAALENCALFYTDRLSPAILGAMAQANSGGAIIYFEPSEIDHSLFADALAITSVLKYSSDRLGPELDDMVAASGAIAIVTYGADGLELRHGYERIWSAAYPVEQVMDTCGSGDMVSVGLIDWLLARASPRLSRLGIHDLMGGVAAGQRLAAENCAFAGARGVFQQRDVAYVRSILARARCDFPA
ncbi:PfkB family carbohydrate kinase [Sphingoaurantiacus capsulatus]|uniref:PfkB family carbohydrate kinase n=1 Tax=Sphingoaurantiacus capsulatus TaxID=1771310 RepID=A0ABV7X506_9SPHN